LEGFERFASQVRRALLTIGAMRPAVGLYCLSLGINWTRISHFAPCATSRIVGIGLESSPK